LKINENKSLPSSLLWPSQKTLKKKSLVTSNYVGGGGGVLGPWGPWGRPWHLNYLFFVSALCENL